MSLDEAPVIRYAVGYVKSKPSIVTLERKSTGWWVIIESKPYAYTCHLFNWYHFANKKFWKLVDDYGLKTKDVLTDKKEVLDEWIKRK